jgi:hypothetical protein
LKILKTTSGFSPRTDPSNKMTFSPSQTHATVPLRTKYVHKRSKHESTAMPGSPPPRQGITVYRLMQLVKKIKKEKDKLGKVKE